MTSTPQEAGTEPLRFVDAPTKVVAATGAELIYRELGESRGDVVPLVGLTHLGANLDSWDPEVVDPLAAERRVILLGYRGVGASTGAVRDGFEDMAADAISAIRALGLSRVDLLGLSMGGMVAQAVIRQAPELVDRVVLASTGPQGGPELTAMAGRMVRTILLAAVTFRSPTTLLFFTRSAEGTRAAQAYQARLKRRRTGRDRRVGPHVFRAQLRAVTRWGREQPPPPLAASGSVLVLHGDSDRMVPPTNADAVLRQYPGALVRSFPDAGHGVVFQHRQTVTELISRFLRR